MGPRSTIDKRILVITCYQNGYSYGQIGDMVNMARSSVQAIVTRFVRENRVCYKSRKAPNKIFTEHEETMIVLKYQNESISLKDLLEYVKNKFNKTCSLKTIHRVLQAAPLAGDNLPLSTDENNDNNKDFSTIENNNNNEVGSTIENNNNSEVGSIIENIPSRLSFANDHLSKSSDFWDSVIFTGVASFSPMYSKIGLKEHHEMKRKYKGGKLVVWGCISAAGVGNLVFVDREMTKQKHLSILKENVIQHAQQFGIRKFHYYQNNNIDHDADIQYWTIWKCPHVMKPPSYDLDINIVDNLWEILDQNIIFHSIIDENDLKAALTQEWKKITPEMAQNLVRTLPNRLQYIVDKAL
ncbi:uncharacterized protein [Drosophila pseudoobscura]|uniref:Transposable element Tc1 transposase n=1 Tax=Drosophila pseudoobscura pseudoobscura TaxID=46245 RepID=A0A6I8W861_DROPS|nr:uncharacterized protein LOC26532114 [Drosophila pseudoobscura]XP_033239565.1 uncharacterized protein LOC26532114 [Drosophila pseudoobscura]